MLTKIYLARAVNQALGGPFVTPWNVYELDDVTLDAIGAIMTELPEIRSGLQKVQSLTEAFRASHPTYRKYKH